MHNAADRLMWSQNFRMHNVECRMQSAQCIADCLVWSRDFSPGGGARALQALPTSFWHGAVRTRTVHRAANARDRSSNQEETTVTMPARSSPVAAPRGNMTNRLPSALMS